MQISSVKLVSAEYNEVSSLKYAVQRALSTLSFGYKGNFKNVKFFVVDVPLSPETFSRLFAEEYSGDDNFKKTIQVDTLNSILGNNWNCFQFPNSATRRRVLGNVDLHFRTKQLVTFEEQDSNRYICLFSRF